MSPLNFSLIAVTTSCYEKRTGKGRDSSEAGREQRMEKLESSWSEAVDLERMDLEAWKHHPLLSDLPPPLTPELETEALEEGKWSCWRSQDVGSRFWNTREAPRRNS